MSHGYSPAPTNHQNISFFRRPQHDLFWPKVVNRRKISLFLSNSSGYSGRFFFDPSIRKAGAPSVEELAQWLKSQHKGLRTYKTFHQKVLELGAQHKQQYALYYLLAMLVWRFVDSYEDSPLTLDVTDEAHKHLVAVTERCAQFDAMSVDERLRFLNEIAAMELTQGLARP
jgi:hypothetical protein